MCQLLVISLLVIFSSEWVRADSLHRSSSSVKTITDFENHAGTAQSAAGGAAIATDSILHRAAADASADAAAAAGAGSAAAAIPGIPTIPGGGVVTPPVVDPPPPTPPVLPHPVFPGAGAGIGFHKNIDFSAGKGIGLLPLLSGLIPGLGGAAVPPPITPVATPPPPPPEGGILSDPALAGGGILGGGLPAYLGLPFLGPSYIPSTWVGSALGAKGDLLFPVVIFLFAIVGVFAVVQFLLALLVPLIGKLLLVKGAVAAKKVLRAVEDDPAEERESILDSLTHTVMAALTEEKCLKLITCQTGNFMKEFTGQNRVLQIADYVKSFNSSSEVLKVFEDAASNGSDCSQFSCWGQPGEANHTMATNAKLDGLHSHKPLSIPTSFDLNNNSLHTHDPVQSIFLNHKNVSSK